MTEPRIERRPGGQRFVTRTDWLTEYASFSFGSHYDPSNTGFGPLLAHNEEWLHPGTGFDEHAHANTEIVTWVLSGALVYTDSNGHRGVAYPGQIQHMSAGRGIRHTERNDAYPVADGYRVDPNRVTEPAHYLQMWVRPDQLGLAPSYDQRRVDHEALSADWVPVASGPGQGAAVQINAAAATLWATRLERDESRTLPGRRPLAHVFVARGSIECAPAAPLRTGDALRITGAQPVGMTARDPAEILVWEMTDEVP